MIWILKKTQSLAAQQLGASKRINYPKKTMSKIKTNAYFYLEKILNKQQTDKLIYEMKT